MRATINGMLSFMLTPGAWAPHAPLAVYKAIFNPTYLPTTLIRALAAFALAGVGAVALVSFVKAQEGVREKVVALAYRMMLPAVLCVPLLGWVLVAVPERARVFLMGGAPVMTIFHAFGMASFGILTLAALLSLWRRDYRPSTLGATLLVLLAFVSLGSFEFVREGIRKPFLIDGFMYSTGVTTARAAEVDTVATLARTRQVGILHVAPWALPPGKTLKELGPVTKGESVYRAACLRCHSVDGYNAIRPLVRGWRRATVRDLLEKMNEVKASMPPFPGTDAEKEALADYLVTLNPAAEEGAR